MRKPLLDMRGNEIHHGDNVRSALGSVTYSVSLNADKQEVELVREHAGIVLERRGPVSFSRFVKSFWVKTARGS